MPAASLVKRQRYRTSDSEEAICARAWQQFESQFPTEKHCWRELCRRIKSNGQVKCCHCGSKDLDKHFAARVRRCRSCNKKTWLTAGTFFNRMRLAKPWLAAIWLMEQGVVISSLKLHKLTGVAQSSALTILKKVATVIESNFGEDAATMSSGHFSLVFCKRSRLTPARGHPIEEQEEMERNGQDNPDLVNSAEANRASPLTICGRSNHDIANQAEFSTGQTSTDNELEGQEKEIYYLLSDKPVLFDGLLGLTTMPVSELSATLTMLEITGFAERLPGDRYIRVSKHIGGRSLCDTTPQATNAVLGLINFVRSKFHGISRKYVQLYLAVHWFYIARSRWCNGSLLRACLDFGCITYNQILAYVSPLMVKCSLEQM